MEDKLLKNVDLESILDFGDKVNGTFMNDIISFANTVSLLEAEKQEILAYSSSPAHQYKECLNRLNTELHTLKMFYINIKKLKSKISRLLGFKEKSLIERKKEASKFCIPEEDVIDVELTVLDCEANLQICLTSLLESWAKVRNYTIILSTIRKKYDARLLSKSAFLSYDRFHLEQKVAQDACYSRLGNQLGVSPNVINSARILNHKSIIDDKWNINLDIAPSNKDLASIAKGVKIKKIIENDLALFEDMDKQNQEKDESGVKGDEQKTMADDRDRIIPEI